jgi:hypothetical protein
MTFWKLALLLSSGKETPNLVDPLHRAILSHSLTENSSIRKWTKFRKRKLCHRGKDNIMKQATFCGKQNKDYAACLQTQ